MHTVYDYLDYYNNVSFKESSWNDMDNVVLSALSYLPGEGILEKSAISINELNSKLSKIKVTTKSAPANALKILKEISKGIRYRDLSLANYISIVDDTTQFCAMTFRFNKNNCYVAFKGTDNSLIGWKEDFDLSYMYPVPAQKLATDYLKNTLKFSDKIIYVGGHSKGGNLAMASVIETDNKLYNRIETVYNNDGPGFLNKEYSSEKYKKMQQKLKMFIPEESMVGILLLNTPDYVVVKSKAKGILQHDLTTWDCFGGFLVSGKLATSSYKMKQGMEAWLNQTSIQNREILVNTLFKVLRESGVKEFKEFRKLKWPQISAMISQAKEVDEKSKKLLLETLKALTKTEAEKPVNKKVYKR